ncbi:MAG TPA: hypothetical protein VIG40_02875 [Tissierellaceae bacterium]
MRVYYGIDRLNKIMKKPCFTVLYLNTSGGLLCDHEKKIKQRMNVFYSRKQSEAEWDDSKKSNRVFTVYRCYIYEKPFNGQLDFILNNNYHADENNASEEERLIIKEKLKRALLLAYPDLLKDKGQKKILF